MVAIGRLLPLTEMPTRSTSVPWRWVTLQAVRRALSHTALMRFLARLSKLVHLALICLHGKAARGLVETHLHSLVDSLVEMYLRSKLAHRQEREA